MSPLLCFFFKNHLRGSCHLWPFSIFNHLSHFGVERALESAPSFEGNSGVLSLQEARALDLFIEEWPEEHANIKNFYFSREIPPYPFS
jgi:hypothetical protein